MALWRETSALDNDRSSHCPSLSSIAKNPNLLRSKCTSEISKRYCPFAHHQNLLDATDPHRNMTPRLALHRGTRDERDVMADNRLRPMGEFERVVANEDRQGRLWSKM
jgi:hypothetical protein